MNFDIAFDRLLGHEGKLSLDPKDSGNWTGGRVGRGELKGSKFGISAASYPKEDIANLTQARAKELFKRDFWDEVHGDDLYDGVAWQLSDFAYHSGADTAIRKYQAALRVSDDGVFGPVSRAAACEMSESDQIMRLIAQRLRYMNRLSNWKHYSRGWTNRMADNLDYGAEDS